MQVRVWLLVAALAELATACFEPSEAQLGCYRGCGAEKDACILAATTAAQIQTCDVRSSRCTATCQ
jgi:hypothetical protein